MTGILGLVNAVALQALSNTIITQWIGPLVIFGIAAFALFFLKDRAWMKVISFAGIAAVVALLVYGGAALFGENGSLTKTAQSVAKQVDSN